MGIVIHREMGTNWYIVLLRKKASVCVLYMLFCRPPDGINKLDYKISYENLILFDSEVSAYINYILTFLEIKKILILSKIFFLNFRFYFYFYLFEGKRENTSHPLVHSPTAYNS